MKDLENRGETNAIGKPLEFWIHFIQAQGSIHQSRSVLGPGSAVQFVGPHCNRAYSSRKISHRFATIDAQTKRCVILVKALTRFIEEDNSYYKEIFMKYSTNPVQIAAIKLWEELLEDLIEFLEYEADRKTRTWTDITHFKILQIKVKGLFDKLLEEYDIEENELAGYAPYFLQFTEEYLDTFDAQVISQTKERIKIS